MKCIQGLIGCVMYGCSFLSLAQGGDVLLAGKDNTNTVSQLQLKADNIQLRDDGSFEHGFLLDTPSFVNLEMGNQDVELFLCPGDSLFVSIDATGLQFSGKGAEINTFLVDHRKRAQDNSEFLDEQNEKVFTRTPQAFTAIIDSLEHLETKLFDAFVKDGSLVSIHFKERIYTDITFRNRRYRLLYPQNYHRHHEYREVAPVASTYLEEVMQGSFDDSAMIKSSHYLRCVNFYLDLLATGPYKMKHPYHAPVKRMDARYNAIIDLGAQEAIQDALIKAHFDQHIWTYRVEALAKSYDRAKLDVKDPSIRNEIKNLMDVGHNRRNDADTVLLYKTTSEAKLYAHVFLPKDKSSLKPAHLFFHGGGWAMGMPEWSYGACKEAAVEGRVGITFDYRLRNVHGATIKDAVGDALAAVAWVRENAPQLGIDIRKILVEGFSAGGHLALATAMVDQKEFGIPEKYSARPDALILGSTPYDVTHRDVYDVPYDAKEISPLFLVQEGLPPILAFHGEDDTMVKFSEFEAFWNKMEGTSNTFHYRSFPNAGHFFNGGAAGDRALRQRMQDTFLIKNGFLD